MMSIYGMLSAEEIEEGYDIALDNDWYAVLTKDNEVLARFDPRGYTSTQLLTQVNEHLENLRVPQASPE